MDSTAHITSLIDQLDDNLDNLQEALKTILNKSLTEVASEYPVLDRAKLYILVTYAIESAIFSFLRLTGTSAREHPVYRELERVKQYFQKAKLVETSLQKPAMRLDQAAAGRFIKAALAGNDVAAGKQNTKVESQSLQQSIGSSPSESKIPKKRKLEDLIQKPPASGTSQNGPQTPSDDLEDDGGQGPDPTDSSKRTSVAATPTKQAADLTPAEELSASESALHNTETKKERKKRRKAEALAKKNSTTKDTAGDESTTAESSKKRSTTKGKGGDESINKEPARKKPTTKSTDGEDSISTEPVKKKQKKSKKSRKSVGQD